MKKVIITIDVPTEWEHVSNEMVVEGFRTNPSAWDHTVTSNAKARIHHPLKGSVLQGRQIIPPPLNEITDATHHVIDTDHKYSSMTHVYFLCRCCNRYIRNDRVHMPCQMRIKQINDSAEASRTPLDEMVDELAHEPSSDELECPDCGGAGEYPVHRYGVTVKVSCYRCLPTEWPKFFHETHDDPDECEGQPWPARTFPGGMGEP